MCSAEPGGRGLLKTMLTVNGNDKKTLTLQVSTQSSPIIDEIGRKVKWCIEVDIEVLKTKEIEPEEAIKLLHSRICRCKAQTFISLATLGSKFLGIVSKNVTLYCISYMLTLIGLL